MLNSIGLANVGLEAFRAEKLPWLRDRLDRPACWSTWPGRCVEDYIAVLDGLDDAEGFLGYELNVSCPNVKEGGAVFCARRDLLDEVVSAARERTERPLVVKLAPNLPDIGGTAAVAVDAGADGLTLINTFPGLLFDVDPRTGPGRRHRRGQRAGGAAHGRPRRLAGGPAGRRTRHRRRWDQIGADAVQYLLAGASLVEIGTATFADPRASGAGTRGTAAIRRSPQPSASCGSGGCGPWTLRRGG
jgi:dihydroorotate dehydrogenase (NAD+) catalytic subunit